MERKCVLGGSSSDAWRPCGKPSLGRFVVYDGYENRSYEMCRDHAIAEGHRDSVERIEQAKKEREKNEMQNQISGNTFEAAKPKKMTKKQIALDVVTMLSGKLKYADIDQQIESVEIAAKLYEGFCSLHGLGIFSNRRELYNSFSSALRDSSWSVFGNALERERYRLGYKASKRK